MMKKKYICPQIETLELISEGAMMQASGVNNAYGSESEDDTKSPIHTGTDGGITVDSKDNDDMWGNSYNVWE